jgi:hypothetical protein
MSHNVPPGAGTTRVRFVAVMAGEGEEVCDHVMIALEMLGGEAVGTVKEDGG